jgi:hypothetical protein
MKKLEITGHIYSNVNGRIIVTPPLGISGKEKSIESYIDDAKFFSNLGNGRWEKTPNGGFRLIKYKKADKVATIPKVKVTITVEEV